ncbi:MAG: glycosyltransferase family 39 protein [Candidatus Micrarchaeota archaeon]
MSFSLKEQICKKFVLFENLIVFTIQSKNPDFLMFLLLAVIYGITRLPAIFLYPLVRDEAIYSIVITEQILNPTLIPTFLSYSIGWKPQLFYWIYSMFAQLPLPLEIAYRFPSFLFGFATLIPLYYLLRNIGASRNVSFFTLIVFLFSFITVYPHTTVLADSLMFFFMMCGLYFYTDKNPSGWKFTAASFFSFAAFFVKPVIPIMVPLLAIAYYYYGDKKIFKNQIFLLSLLAIPLAFALHYLMLDAVGLAEENYILDISKRLAIADDIGNSIWIALGSFNMLIMSFGIWFALSLFGLWKHWKSNRFMTVWYAMIIFPILTGFYMPWYYLPVMPAISYFAVILLLKWDGKEKMDALFTAFISMAIIATIVLSSFVYFGLYYSYNPEKEAGNFLSGKENVLIIGEYASSVVAYKILGEYRTDGKWKDFGWILILNHDSAAIPDFIEDYHTDKYETKNGSFSSIFTNKTIFRKDTDITKFDYIVIVSEETNNTYGSIVFNQSNIIIYDIE